MGLQKPIRTLKLSPKLLNLVLHKEPDILSGDGAVKTSSRKNTAMTTTYFNRKPISFLFLIGERSELLSLKDRFSVRVFD